MSSAFSVILEEFEGELAAISALVKASSDPSLASPRARVAGANAATLLLAATFEEFVREVARAFAKEAVETCDSFDDLPPKLASVAWKRTMEALAKIRLDPRKGVFSDDSIFVDALTRFTITYEFCRGDISQDIYTDLIHNENNMRPQEINAMIGICGLKNVCFAACNNEPLQNLMNETEPGRAHSRFVELLENFFERRNQVAHSLNAMRSSGPDQINMDVNLLSKFGFALCDAIEVELLRRQVEKAGRS